MLCKQILKNIRQSKRLFEERKQKLSLLLLGLSFVQLSSYLLKVKIFLKLYTN